MTEILSNIGIGIAALFCIGSGFALLWVVSTPGRGDRD